MRTATVLASIVLLFCEVASAQVYYKPAASTFQGALISGCLSSRTYAPARCDSQLRAEGYTRCSDGSWVRTLPVGRWRSVAPRPAVSGTIISGRHESLRFDGNPRFPIRSPATKPYPADNAQLNLPPPPKDPVQPSQPPKDSTGGGDKARHDAILEAIKQNNTLLAALRTQVDPKANKTEVRAAIDTVVANQTKLLAALSAMTGSMGSGGDEQVKAINDLAIQIQRNTQTLDALVAQVQTLDGNQAALATSLTDIQTQMSSQETSTQSLSNQVAAVSVAVNQLDQNQAEFDHKLGELALKVQNIERGHFRFRMQIDPATGKVVALEPSKNADSGDH